MLFDFSKNCFFFRKYCSQLTGQCYCPLILFTGTVGHNTKIVLQHNLPTSLLPCNTIFQLPSLAIHSCILQYNFHVVCFPTILQYNVTIQFPPSLAIQSLATTQSRLQYNFVLQLNLDYFCNTIQATQAFFSTIQKLYCNTIFTTIFPALSLAIQLQGLQYKKNIYFFFSQYNLGSSPKTIQPKIFFFFIMIIIIIFHLLNH